MDNGSRQERSGRWKVTPLFIAVVYVILAGGWIVLSDRALTRLVPDPAAVVRLQTWKGLLYVLGTAVVLWVLARRGFAQYESARCRAEAGEQRLHRLMSVAPIGIISVDRRGHITYVNEAAARIAGCSPEALIGVWIGDQRWRLEHPDGRPLMPADLPLARVLETGRPLGGVRLTAIRPDGTKRHLEAAVAPVPGAGSDTEYICVVMDVTDRVAMETEVLRERELIRTLIHLAPAYFVAVNPDGTIRMANETMLQHLGWTMEELRGKDIISFLGVPEEQPRLREILASMQAGRKLPAVECRVVDRTGRHRTVEWHGTAVQDASGRLDYFFGFGLDVTRQREIERTLRERTERLHAILENAADGFVVIDGTGTIVEFNASAERLLHRSRAEVVGRTFEEALPTLADSELARQLRRAIGSDEPLEFETWVEAEPHRGWYEARVVPHRAGAALFFQSITERKRIQHELRTLNAELESRIQTRTAQLEAINRELETFAYAVSHDLRVPLRAIDGFSRILLADHAEQLNEDGRSVLQTIIGSVKRMNSLIENLLAFVRLNKKELRLATVDMRRLIDDACAEVRAARPGRDVEVLVGDLPAVTADRELLRQVFVQLLDNAFKFTDRAERPRVEIAGTTENGMHVFTVADNGIGFDPRFAGRLFGIFQRMHPPGEYEGAGIGLAMVKRIVHRHEGWVRAHGEPHRGTTVTIGLPVRSGEGST